MLCALGALHIQSETHLAAKPLFTGTDQYNDAAVLYRMLGVIQCFLGLIEINILGSAALGNEHNIRALRKFLQKQPVQKSTALPVRRHRIAGNCINDLFMFIQHHI